MRVHFKKNRISPELLASRTGTDLRQAVGGVRPVFPGGPNGCADPLDRQGGQRLLLKAGGWGGGCRRECGLRMPHCWLLATAEKIHNLEPDSCLWGGSRGAKLENQGCLRPRGRGRHLGPLFFRVLAPETWKASTKHTSTSPWFSLNIIAT